MSTDLNAARVAAGLPESYDDSKSAAENALDDIAVVCGEPHWEYPGQVVRDVIMLRDAMLAEREANIKATCLECRLGAPAILHPEHGWIHDWPPNSKTWMHCAARHIRFDAYRRDRAAGLATT